KEQNLKLAGLDPGLLLEGATPRLIDEWQLAPSLWDAVRFEVDQRDAFNQFILTGSATPAADMSKSHSGTGRIARMIMRPMSLFESEDSNGTVSLEQLFANQQEVSARVDLDLRHIAYLICRGGWPKALGYSERIALRQAYDYYDAVVESDISNTDGVSRNSQRVRLLMRSYARFISSDAKLTSIRADMANNDADALSTDTIYAYINALKGIFVIEDMPAWSPRLRSATTIRTSDTRHFVDPSIAVAALGIGPDDLLRDLNTMGLLFESMCIRDLRIYAEALGGMVSHYRDKSGLECDAVVHLRNGSYGLVEVKLGGDDIEMAAKNLNTLSEKIDLNRMPSPSFMMIMTGTSYAYRREDGIYVIPAGCLRV
ncbi:MAG: ATP-binding protein, partial [Firmicutes bacterium]|nr:ATP-binding protein [Bacillota bacterium]